MNITVKTSTGDYSIILKRGALKEASKYFDLNRKVLIVTDSGIPASYAECVAAQCQSSKIYTFPQGESSKNLETLSGIWKAMAEFDMTRSDCVVAVGGGVTGDMAGFSAACYMRGIDFYNIPTTVLSQVDSSIGGKTAVDFEGYKNMIGAFYPPKGVIIDADTLSTLPARQISNGLAESVKMAMTSDSSLFALFENENPFENLEQIICKSLLIKKSVVEQDEKESGLRKILNFGHTLAHAIETQTGFEDYYHGECVAIGMMPMCGASIRPRLQVVLDKLSLPHRPAFDMDIISNAMRHDKKMSGNDITVVFVPEIGTFELKKMPFSEFDTHIRKEFA